jgi:hypothetical protein
MGLLIEFKEIAKTINDFELPKVTE